MIVGMEIMANSINPVGHGMQNKIGDKLGDTSSTQKLDLGSPSAPRLEQQQSGTNDTVQLTHSAKLLERTEKSLAEAPTADSAKIAAVRADIEKGDYVINADKIADALLRTDMELGK